MLQLYLPLICCIFAFTPSTPLSLTNSGLTISGSTDLTVSEKASINCSTDLQVESIAWLYQNEVISSVAGEQHLVLTFDRVSDSQHGRVYMCQSVASYGTQERNVTVNVQSKWPLLFVVYWDYNYRIM